jgi:hypothetical protein
MTTVHTVVATKLIICLMPASRAALTRCICEECSRKGGYDEKGIPRGVLIAECSISAHIQHVKADSTAYTITGQSTISSITDVSDICPLGQIIPIPYHSHLQWKIIWIAQDHATFLQFLSLSCQIASSSWSYQIPHQPRWWKMLMKRPH